MNAAARLLRPGPTSAGAVRNDSTPVMKKLIITCLLAVSAAAWAQTTVKVQDAWVRGTVATQQATGAFMRLTADKAARLVGVESPAAGAVEMHEMSMDKNVMRMRQISGIDLAPGSSVELKPGGLHLMLLDLKAPLKAGDSVALTLIFEDAAKQRFTQQVTASVTSLAGGNPADNKSGHHPHHGSPMK